MKFGRYSKDKKFHFDCRGYDRNTKKFHLIVKDTISNKSKHYTFAGSIEIESFIENFKEVA